MGLKRKASDFEEFIQYPASTLPSPPQSHCSASSFDGVHDDNHTWGHYFRSAPTHMNMRTRKRHRDDRPDQEVVHQSTLQKLFEAQRHPVPEAAQPEVETMMMDQDSAPAEVLPTHTQADRTQRSIGSFFGGKSRHARSNAVQLPPPVMSELVCEDCSVSLSHGKDGRLDGDMMEVDSLMAVDGMEDDWNCSLCRRIVCDTCAVRGDQRTCLECAMPGGGMQQMWWDEMNGCE